MKSINSKQAVKNWSSSKPYSIWASNELDESKLFQCFAPGNGADRVYNSNINIKITPKFKISPNAGIFAAGSCFAREIELALVNKDARVLSWTPGSGLGNQLFHRYNTHSIIYDFQCALDNSYDEKNIVEYGDKWIDFTGHGVGDSREEMLEERLKVIKIYKQCISADVIFLTLGLVEAWYDKTTNSYTNIPPWGHFLGSRFELRVTDYSENRQAIEDFISLVRSKIAPDLKIVLTVSPVPLSDTFSGQDIVVANAYSKSVLRCVAQDIAERDQNCDYFPSYEMVTTANPRDAWYPDFRHVKREFVDQIIDVFLKEYLDQEASLGTAP
ncbi:GSCFA domain-containing protein [Bosea sp. (in: a-proteobacteria)]|uniref:GSCFA domain-containing protein n=1 Tax=Bosea sp. (in: a-proteobacteria) TaxID=1871050 RepID=UPI003F6F9BA0